MDDETILARGGTEEDIKKYAEQNGADLDESDVIAEEMFNTFVDIIDEKGDEAGKEYLKSIFQHEDRNKRQRLIDSIQANEPIYLNDYGNAISEEDYLNFEAWVDSVGKPEGSTIEKFTRYISSKYEG